MKIVLNIEPPTTTHQNKKIVRTAFGHKLADTVELSNARSIYCAMLAPHRPESPLSGPVGLHVEFHFPYRKSEPKKNLGKLLPKDTKPDCDNMAKTLIDCMTRMGFWRDDAQIYRTMISKYWSPSPRVEIWVSAAM